MQKLRHSLVITSLLFLSLLITALSSAGTSQPAKADDCQTFKETGFTVCGKFLTYWNSHGGLAQQGLPISPAFDEQQAPPPAGDGKVYKVQYFQRARFEEHLENQPPYDVLLGLLGSTQYHVKYPTKPASVPHYGIIQCQTFSETGFEVCGDFLKYWQGNGGLAQQGLPISSVIEEKNADPPAGDGDYHQVQYFERARFELHQLNDPPYNVLLGLLGTEQYSTHYRPNLPPPTPMPTSTPIIIQPVSGSTPSPTATPTIIVATPTPTVLLVGTSTPTLAPSPTAIPTTTARPTATVTARPTATATPDGTQIILSVQGVSPGNHASAHVQTLAGVTCFIMYTTPSGRNSTAAGLISQTTDSSGQASWTWLISGDTIRGTGSVTVACNGLGSVTKPITIG